MPGTAPAQKWMWVSALPMPINSAWQMVPIQNASGPFRDRGGQKGASTPRGVLAYFRLKWPDLILTVA